MISARPLTNSARLRQRLSSVYARATRSGSRVFHASSAARTFCAAVSAVKGGRGGRLDIGSLRSLIARYWVARTVEAPLRAVKNDTGRRASDHRRRVVADTLGA